MPICTGSSRPVRRPPLSFFAVSTIAANTSHTETDDLQWVRRRLKALGVCSSTVSANDGDCWIEIIDDLDRLSAFGYGVVTQRRFMLSPHPRLGASPLEVLREDRGPERVRAALRETLTAAFAHHRF